MTYNKKLHGEEAMPRDECIAQWLGMWKAGQKCKGDVRAHSTWDNYGRLITWCDLHGAEVGTHDIPCPDLSTPEMQAKVKAALVEREIPFGTHYLPASRKWAAGAGMNIGPFGKCTVYADSEADALLAAIYKIILSGCWAPTTRR